MVMGVIAGDGGFWWRFGECGCCESIMKDTDAALLGVAKKCGDANAERSAGAPPERPTPASKDTESSVTLPGKPLSKKSRRPESHAGVSAGDSASLDTSMPPSMPSLSLP
jgi:hypothetical protein